MAFFALLLMTAAAMLGLAAAINFFWQTGFKDALAYAALPVGIFLLFWLSGLWEDATPHSWGRLTPLFFIMLLVGWGAGRIVRNIWLAKIKKNP